MIDTNVPTDVVERLAAAARQFGLDVFGDHVRRSSSRFCLGVEHGDYNGTELFGVGTDRFIWLAYKPNNLNRIRLHSVNFADEGVVDFKIGCFPDPKNVADRWSRFPFGISYVLKDRGFALSRGFDGVLYGNIPGGGMSRSASLALNLILTFLEVSEIPALDGMQVVDLAQAVENEYIGSPCGKLDQIMIYFAKQGMGTHFRPAEATVEHVPLPKNVADFRLVSLDTGTVRPGLEKSTYKIRRQECEQLVELCRDPFGVNALADVKDQALYDKICLEMGDDHPTLIKRLTYVYQAQQRFGKLLRAWRDGDVDTVGQIFRQDGFGLRDDYEISGPELESMNEIARTVDGVLGERMLGGGDKGASGAIVSAEAVDRLKSAIDREYPKRHPELADKYAVHACRVVDGIARLDGIG